MKHSNLTAPRTMSDCSFRPSDDPIERFRRDDRAAVLAVWAALALGAVAALVAVVLT